jgi:hypothetical protein
MPKSTITYSPSNTGWTSFHSYFPDWMIGMNSIFYTFKNGNIYKHHNNVSRNQYYGVNYPSTVTAIFNNQPIDAKMFMTLELDSDDPWAAEVVTDLTTGFIDKDYFIKKEGAYYSNIRRYAASQDLSQTSAQGIGACSLVTGVLPGPIIISFAQPISALLSLNDVAYIGTGAGITEIGAVSAISNGVFPAVSTITINTATVLPVVADFIMFLKNSEVESYGSRGHYAEVKFTNILQTESELFAVSSEIFKSFP